jgi:hypothetical protein
MKFKLCLHMPTVERLRLQAPTGELVRLLLVVRAESSFGIENISLLVEPKFPLVAVAEEVFCDEELE